MTEPTLILSPTEHELRKIITTPQKISSLPEKHGCDVVAITAKGIIGFQRKTLPDLVASLHDGRLYLELAQLCSTATIAYPFLVLEADLNRTTTDDRFLDADISLSAIRSLSVKFQMSGVGVLNTRSLADTLSTMLATIRYISSNSFDTIRRPKQLSNEWGTKDSASYASFLLQSFPNIGPSLAKAIYTHFQGVPLTWTVDAAQLAQVPGIGRKRAESLIASLR